MKNILISGLVNTETTCRVRQFPIHYYPIDYPFFGVSTAVSGVAYNLARAMTTLGTRVSDTAAQKLAQRPGMSISSPTWLAWWMVFRAAVFRPEKLIL